MQKSVFNQNLVWKKRNNTRLSPLTGLPFCFFASRRLLKRRNCSARKGKKGKEIKLVKFSSRMYLFFSCFVSDTDGVLLIQRMNVFHIMYRSFSTWRSTFLFGMTYMSSRLENIGYPIILGETW